MIDIVKEKWWYCFNSNNCSDMLLKNNLYCHICNQALNKLYCNIINGLEKNNLLPDDFEPICCICDIAYKFAKDQRCGKCSGKFIIKKWSALGVYRIICSDCEQELILRIKDGENILHPYY